MVQKCEFDNIHLILISSNSLVYFTIKYNTLWSWNFYCNYEKKVQTVIDQNKKKTGIQRYKQSFHWPSIYLNWYHWNKQIHVTKMYITLKM
jgi:hypothetical protein